MILCSLCLALGGVIGAGVVAGVVFAIIEAHRRAAEAVEQ
jgi:hypothetical protein